MPPLRTVLSGKYALYAFENTCGKPPERDPRSPGNRRSGAHARPWNRHIPRLSILSLILLHLHRTCTLMTVLTFNYYFCCCSNGNYIAVVVVVVVVVSNTYCETRPARPPNSGGPDSRKYAMRFGIPCNRQPSTRCIDGASHLVCAPRTKILFAQKGAAGSKPIETWLRFAVHIESHRAGQCPVLTLFYRCNALSLDGAIFMKIRSNVRGPDA